LLKNFIALNFLLVFFLLRGKAGFSTRRQSEMRFFPHQIRSAYWPLWAVILLILAGCGSLKSENEKLKEEIVDVSAENEKLRRELIALKSDNSKMHMRVAQLHLEIAALHQEIQNLQKDVETFRAQLKGGDRKK
jgi:septal ring factor EnvC (AmiA/AmiB activator)